MSSRPEVFIYNHQDVVCLPGGLCQRLELSGRKAMEKVMELAGSRATELRKLPEIEVSLLDDAGIADVHLRFMDIPGATDVITFEHGEIHISVETAKHQAQDFGNAFERELMLYIVHGLLHLAGYDDQTDEERALMDELQQSILTEVW